MLFPSFILLFQIKFGIGNEITFIYLVFLISDTVENLLEIYYIFDYSAMDVGIPVDSPNLVLLFYVVQLFLRELHKSKNLIRIIPMDMTGYYGKCHARYTNVSLGII